MVQIYTGNGKGKTTAAIGLAIRTLGRGNKVCLIQLMKNAAFGEILFLKNFSNIDIFQFGTKEFVNPKTPTKTDFEEAEKAFQKTKDAINSKKYDLIIIDEINVAVSWKLLPVEKQLELMELTTNAEIVMTGRHASKEVLAKADLVTEMKEIKHYFAKGIPARKGIEF